MALKHYYTDPGNCADYWIDGKRVYCWMADGKEPDGSTSYTFYACSSDGEPSHEVYGFRDGQALPPKPYGVLSE